MSLSIPFPLGWLLNKKAARVEVNISLAFLLWVEMALHPWLFVSDIAIFVLKGDVKLELTNLCSICADLHIRVVIYTVLRLCIYLLCVKRDGWNSICWWTWIHHKPCARFCVFTLSHIGSDEFTDHCIDRLTVQCSEAIFPNLLKPGIAILLVFGNWTCNEFLQFCEKTIHLVIFALCDFLFMTKLHNMLVETGVILHHHQSLLMTGDVILPDDVKVMSRLSTAWTISTLCPCAAHTRRTTLAANQTPNSISK